MAKVSHKLKRTDLCRATVYLINEGFSEEEINKGLVYLTPKQHKQVHELEGEAL